MKGREHIMKNKKLLRYFKNYTPFIGIGAVLVVVGFLIDYFAYEIWVLGMPILAAGLVLVVLGMVMGVSDANYLVYFTDKADSARSDNPHEEAPDYTADEFVLEGNSYGKLDKSQKPRSELFVRTDIFFGKKTIEVISYRVNLLDDSLASEKHEFPLSDVTASVEEKETRVRGNLKKLSYMTISAGDEKITFPVRYNDIEVDQLTERINDAKKHLA